MSVSCNPFVFIYLWALFFRRSRDKKSLCRIWTQCARHIVSELQSFNLTQLARYLIIE